ncbi:MAG: hypothetical protein D6731_06630 [Planctomycetota bacterium]|nr:MAG: hypothetical protein D6731_06630 [Planctomycetota bacterium]
MAREPRSATQILRQAQSGQLLEHVAAIQRLEARAKALEAELETLRAGGGTRELQRLPSEALEALLGVFDAVPIPDLAAWERRGVLARLEAALRALEEEGRLPAGCWDPAGPALRVREGDGAATAAATAAVLRALADAAAGYLARMVEHQGTTPDAVARARAASLMDFSSLADAKAHYAVLPPEAQRELFEENVDELIRAKDQLASIAAWLSHGRQLAQRLVERRGLAVTEGASLTGLLEALLAAEAPPEPTCARRLAARVQRWADLLPRDEARELLALRASEFQRTFAAALDPAAPLAFLARALCAVLDDHLAACAAFQEKALAKRERQALSGLRKEFARAPADARKHLLGLVAQDAHVEEAQAAFDAAAKALVEASGPALERCARAAMAKSSRPEAEAAAFERLDKRARTASLAELWRQRVRALRALLDPSSPEGLPTLRAARDELLRATVGAADPQLLAQRARALDVLAEALRDPDPGDDASSLDVSAPIPVEEELLARQAEELEKRSRDFLSRYAASRSQGPPTLEATVRRLEDIAELKKGKKAALDRLLKPSRRGKHSPKRELAAGAALLEEHALVAEARGRLAARKEAAVGRVAAELPAFGLVPGLGYDALRAAVDARRAEHRRAAEVSAALAAAEERARDLVGSLTGQPPASFAEVEAFAQRAGPDADALDRLAAEVVRARERALAAANRLLRKPCKDYASARQALAAVESGLDAVSTLRAAAGPYFAGLAAADPALAAAAPSLARLRRERRKAGALAEEAAAASEALARSVERLADLAPRSDSLEK